MGWSTERDGRRARGDRGVALVEFSFVMVLLFALIFGIINYGLILSFKQDMTRAAAEGARAGATAFPATNAQADADAATSEAVRSFGGDNWKNNGCSRTGMTCSVTLVDCATMLAVTPSTTEECIVVELTYDYDGHPLYGEVPLIGGLIKPDEITAKSVARTNA
jgi:Flp pilus assembly protein TadG